MAILGCGGMAGAHAQRFRNHPDVEIVACCDVSTEVVEGFIKRNLGELAVKPKVFTDPATMYREAKPEAVTIVTPHTMHYDHGVQALEAGCHVLMEKPMVTNAEQAHLLAAKVAVAKRILVVGYNSPCTPELQYTRETIRSGRLGRLELVSGWLSQDWKRATAGSWRQKPELSGGGQAYDSGAHLLNSVCWSVESDIAQVFAAIDNLGTPVDINSAITIRFANGVLGNIVVGGNCRSSGCNLTYCFENGRIDVDGWGGNWIRVYERDQVKYPAIPGTSQSPNDNFVDAILGRAEPCTSPRNGIVQSELMDAIYESARTGQPARPRRAAAAR
jgi:predicted dehydrogenase